MGRPSDYTPELAAQICSRLAQGESLRQICRDEGMPDKSTVLRWADKDETFRDQYARAREALVEHWAEEIVEISDDGSNDWVQRETDSGAVISVVDHEHVSRSKLRVDSRKWLMSKLAPKKYGDKIQHAGDGGGPVKMVVEWNKSSES